VDFVTFRSRFRPDLDFEVMDGSAKPPTEGRLRQAERRLGVRFPDCYREFVRFFGVLIVEARERVWPRDPGAVPSSETWRFNFGLYVPGVADGVIDFFQLSYSAAELRPQGLAAHPVLPVIRWPRAGDAYCIDARGRMSYWCPREPDRLEPVAGGFFELLVKEMAALRRRKQRLVGEAGRAEPSAAADPARPFVSG